MPITIKADSLFKQGYSLKYLTGWDNNFKKDKYTGVLSFYNGLPQYVVDVELVADRNKLTEEDIIITIGNLHNSPTIEDLITKKKDLIYELCKSTIEGEFLLDLDAMKVIQPSDFIGNFPIHGLNTLFMFENIPYKFFCLVNPSKNIKDSEFFSWFVSYIYSMYICLTPRDKIEDYPKKFLQAISGLACSKGKVLKITNRATVLNCELSDIGELLLPIPGNKTKRFEQLVESSLEQMAKKGHKKK